MVHNTPLFNIKAYLPIAESFGFTSMLREMTQGKAFPQCSFDSWSIVKGDPFEEKSDANQIVKQIRERKGMKDKLPVFADYNDKL